MPERAQRMPTVLLGPLDIVGYYSALARGLREIGCNAQLLHLGAERSGRWDDKLSAAPIRWYKSAQSAFEKTRARSRRSPWRYAATGRMLAAQAALIAWIAFKCDILVLKSGQSLMSSRFDLRLFRWLGKKIIFIYHGSDSRPPYLNGYFVDWDMRKLADWTRKIRAEVDRAAPFADVIVDNPLSAQFQTRRCCLYQALGNMIDEARLRPGREAPQESDTRRLARAVRILHAPSLTAVKGTDRIRTCIERLRSMGHDIDYVEITGRPNAEVVEEISRSDIVIDELYSDIHGAMLATEATALGRPVIVCGYGQPEFDRLLPPEVALPSEYGQPEMIEELLLRLVTDRGYRGRRAAAAGEFYDRYSHARHAARRLLEIASGRAPETWFFDPSDIRHVHGFGGDESVMRRLLRRYIETCGEDALLLDEKPELRRRIIEFAYAAEAADTARTVAA